VSARKPPSRAARLKKARAEAAAALGLPDSDLHVKRYALLSVEYDNLTARYLSGDRLDVSELTRIESAMQEIRATLPPPIQEVAVTIVSRKEVQECPSCGHSFPTQKAPQTLEERIAKARLEERSQQSSPASPPLVPASTHDAADNNHAPQSDCVARRRAPAAPELHEVIAKNKDTRPVPAAPIPGSGGSLVWYGSNGSAR
jgi:hypothetical protein